jgi:hypothetical protein
LFLVGGALELASSPFGTDLLGRMDTGERDRHQRVSKRASTHQADLDAPLPARDPEAARRTIEGNNTLSALPLFAGPDEESGWTQVETAQRPDLHLE